MDFISTQKDMKRYKSFLTLVIIFFALLLSIGLRQSIYDDAWMFARYSQNFLSGNGFSWNAIDGPSAGITSPAYLYLFTLLSWILGLPYNLLLKSLSFVFALLSSVTIYMLIYATFSGNDNIFSPKYKSLSLLSLICTLTVVVRIILFHSGTGMETTTALFLNSLFCILLINSSKIRNNFAYIFLGIFSICLRPEYGLFVILTPSIFFAIDKGKAFNKKTFTIITKFTAALILISIVYFLSFSEIVPLPFFSKSSSFFEGYIGSIYWNPSTYMRIFFTSLLPFLGIYIISARKGIKVQNLFK